MARVSNNATSYAPPDANKAEIIYTVRILSQHQIFVSSTTTVYILQQMEGPPFSRGVPAGNFIWFAHISLEMLIFIGGW